MTEPERCDTYGRIRPRADLNPTGYAAIDDACLLTAAAREQAR